MNLSSLQDLFMHDLKDMLDAERRLVKALPKMANAATSEHLRAAFEDHFDVTEKQVDRLMQIFDEIGKGARGKKCLGMMGLIDEGVELIGEKSEGAVLDIALIGAAQKVEHYEICAYRGLIHQAKMLGFDNAARLLAQNLEEEQEADQVLAALEAKLSPALQETRELQEA